MADVVKVLSINGGGIRGIIPAIVLAEIKRRAGKPAAELFDLIAGTSTWTAPAARTFAPRRLLAEEIIKIISENDDALNDLCQQLSR